MNAKEFTKIAIADKLNYTVKIRDYKISEIYRLGKGKRLRTRKNDHQVEAWDILGNVTILDCRGRVLNLTKAEYDATRKKFQERLA